MTQEMLTLLTGFGGAIIGGLLSIAASATAHKLAQRAKKHDESEATVNEIRLIKLEIEKLWTIYDNDLGGELESLSKLEPLMVTLPIGQNTFPIFDSRPACLAKLSPETASEVFYWYSRAKGIVKITQTNNKNILKALEFAAPETLKLELMGHIDIECKRSELERKHLDRLRGYAQRTGMLIDAQTMKGLHAELAKKTPLTIKLLEKDIAAFGKKV